MFAALKAGREATHLSFGHSQPSKQKQSRHFMLLSVVLLSLVIPQSLLLWKLWHRSVMPDVLGEIHGLVPSGES